MALIKISTTLLIQWKFWESVKNLVLSPFSNANIELILFMLVIPFFVNLLIFWVTDNFLMRHDHHQHKRSFFVNYVNKLNKNQSNGFSSNGHGPAANGNGSINANGKFAHGNLLERAKNYCSSRLDNDSYNMYMKHDKQNRFNELIDNDSESDALLSGDERFDVDFMDDDCVALEPRDLRSNL